MAISRDVESIYLQSPDWNDPQSGVRAVTDASRRRFFHLSFHELVAQSTFVPEGTSRGNTWGSNPNQWIPMGGVLKFQPGIGIFITT